MSALQEMDDEEEMNKRRRCRVIPFFLGKMGLFVMMTSYALMGGFLFKYLEGEADGHNTSYVQKTREDCLRELWVITGKEITKY